MHSTVVYLQVGLKRWVEVLGWTHSCTRLQKAHWMMMTQEGQVVNVIQTEPKAATHSRGARVTAEVVGASFIDACFAAQRTMEQTNVSS